LIRKAKIDDVKRIHHLLDKHGEGAVIPRSLSELYEHLRDFYVHVGDDGEIGGVSALHIAWDNLAEVRSLVVANEHKGKNIGKMLVKECLNDAKELGIENVFVLTFIPEYFKKLGFRPIDKGELPHKIWSDCVKCVKFPDCDETAMLFKFEN
jgi:amino-acid N-acetyltransferase